MEWWGGGGGEEGGHVHHTRWCLKLIKQTEARAILQLCFPRSNRGAIAVPFAKKLRNALHRLLLGKRERCSRAGGGEARVGVGGLVGRMLLIGVLRQEGDGRVGGRSGLRLGEGFRVTGLLVAHDFSGIQLLWTPSRVLPGAEQTHTHTTAG